MSAAPQVLAVGHQNVEGDTNGRPVAEHEAAEPRTPRLVQGRDLAVENAARGQGPQEPLKPQHAVPALRVHVAVDSIG